MDTNNIFTGTLEEWLEGWGVTTLIEETTTLTIQDNTCSVIHPDIHRLKNLQVLNLFGTNIRFLPDTITRLEKLTVLHLSQTNLEFLPHDIGKLKNLEQINVAYTHITALPKSLYTLKKLKGLDIGATYITKISRRMFKLPSLIKLELGRTTLCLDEVRIPRNTTLLHLDISNTKTSTLNKSFNNLESLTGLFIEGLNITTISDKICLKYLKTLYINREVYHNYVKSGYDIVRNMTPNLNDLVFYPRN